ncbi:MAG: DUF4349 domain-containing protein [Methanophagales archaeon ANME-1-THS]|nr:MAG: DUF4349 domain-containing protein [Methanophagales archaeon ANME-1-THS]
MERSKLAVILLLCIVSASAGFLLARMPGLKEPTGYPALDTWSEKGVTAPVPQVVPVPTPGLGGRGATESYESGMNTERKIIQRASVRIEVKDFQARSDALFEIVERSNGFVSDSYSYVTATGHRRGEITIRVPKDKFLSAIHELEQLGTVQSKQISGEDVTEEYIDLQARLNNSERQEKRLLEILEKADEVKDILEVERELERVRGEIERLTGRITYLENRVELATISVSLYEPEPITQSWGIRDALRTSFAGFVAVIRGLIIAVGYLLPFVILVGLGWLLKARVIPRLRRRAQK